MTIRSTTRNVLASALLCAFAASGPALAQGAAERTGTMASPAPTVSNARADRPIGARDVRISHLIGMQVRNAQNEGLGEIKDLVIDTRAERVEYAIIEFGGFLGFNEKLFAYPLSAFRVTADRNELFLDVPRERLSQAPGFARDNWPNNWTDSANAPTGRNPMAQADSSYRTWRASQLLGADLRGRDGNDAGEIQDMVVSLRDGRIRYVVMQPDRAWNLGERLVQVQLGQLAFGEREGDIRLRADRNAFDRSRTFADNRWPGDVMRLSDTRAGTVADPRRTTVMPGLGAGAAAGTGAAAAAGMVGRSDRDTFGSLDVNGDGVITRADLEQIANTLRDWERLDRDNDGRVTQDEFMNRQR